MTPLPAKVTAIGKQGQQYRAVVQIRSKYRGSVTTLVFGELKPHTGFLKGSRLDLVYYLSEPRSERGRSIPPLDSPLKRTKARAERRRKFRFRRLCWRCGVIPNRLFFMAQLMILMESIDVQ
jgi:hypothetical protein